MPAKIDHGARKANMRQLIAAGKSNREIAVRLGLDLRTVDHYIRRYGLSRLRRKLGIRRGPSPRVAVAASRRECLGCGTPIPAQPGRWLCDGCRARRASGSRGVPDHWLETSGHA
jgi:regulatory LuxR family protein